MFRFKAIVAAAACTFSATTASAAVATYSGETYAWFQLDSVFFAGTEIDARHLLGGNYGLADYYLDREGRTTFHAEGDPSPYSYTRWWSTGEANNHSPSAGIYADEWFAHEYYNESETETIDLTFSYVLEARATARRTGDGDAWAHAFSEILFGPIFLSSSYDSHSVSARVQTGSRRSSAQAMSGSVTFTVAPEEYIAATAYYGILGGAEVAPVPVAGALPLLGTALAALGFAARRRARRAAGNAARECGA